MAALELEAARTSTRLSAIEGLLATTGNKVDKLLSGMARHEAEPKADPFKILTFIMQAAMLFALTVSGIVYVASSVNSTRLAVLEERMSIIVMKGSKNGI